MTDSDETSSVSAGQSTSTYGAHEAALGESLKAADLPLTDRAGITLARHYALLLDEITDRGDDAAIKILIDLGPKYQAILTALGLTKAGRGVAAPKPGGGDHVPGDQLDDLRERRLARRLG